MSATNILKARRLGINTQHEAVIFMHKNCPVCRAEGFSAHTRVRISHGSRSIIATVYHVTDGLVALDEAGLSDVAWNSLELTGDEEIAISHPRPLESLARVRAKLYGNRLGQQSFHEIIDDIVAGRYSDIHLSSFLTACATNGLDTPEIVALTHAMIDAGDRLQWDSSPVMDKHCVGGLPGNRTTPIVVAIVAACGLIIPKTSSRAITSPAGTADTMEAMAPVDLDIQTMRRVVEQEGGCIAWGGAMCLSPADDILIRVERALDLDTEGQLIASVLSKKISAGATHIVLDIPVGPKAKVRNRQAADRLASRFLEVSDVFGVQTKVVITDGSQPIGRGIGPALEARDVLAVLRCANEAPGDLRDRSLLLAGSVLDLSDKGRGAGISLATEILNNGKAWKKFQRICEAQGGMRKPPVAKYQHPFNAQKSGVIGRINNRSLAKVAKLAGAPDDKAAGLELLVRLGDTVEKGQSLFDIHAETPGELNYALDYVNANPDVITMGVR
jgi:thymidine phosphorylase